MTDGQRHAGSGSKAAAPLGQRPYGRDGARRRRPRASPGRWRRLFAGLAEAPMQWLSQAAEMMSPKARLRGAGLGRRSRRQRLDARGARLLGRRRPAPDPVLGRDAQARQPDARALPQGQAAGPGLRLRPDRRRPPARAAGQLHAAAHQARAGRRDRPQEAAVRDRRPARRPRPRHRRHEGIEPGRRRAARRPSGLFRRLPSRARARPDDRRRRLGGGAVPAQGPGAAIPRPKASRSWSATARPAGRS